MNERINCVVYCVSEMTFWASDTVWPFTFAMVLQEFNIFPASTGKLTNKHMLFLVIPLQALLMRLLSIRESPYD